MENNNKYYIEELRLDGDVIRWDVEYTTILFNGHEGLCKILMASFYDKDEAVEYVNWRNGNNNTQITMKELVNNE